MTPATNPFLSVVLVNYNGASFLADLLHDLDHQSTPPGEVLVVDNGSTDTSRAVVAAHPRATWIPATENRGYGQAANEGIQQAQGDLVLVGNTDLRLPADFVERALDCANRHLEAALISPLIMRFDHKTVDSAGQYPAWNLHVREHGFGRPLSELQPLREGACFSVCGAATLINRAYLGRISLAEGAFYDPDFFMFWEDYELGWRVQRRGMKVLFDPRIRLAHFRSATLPHGATGRGGLSRSRPPLIRAHIILNRYLTLIRHLSAGTLLRRLPFLLVYDLVWLLWLLLPTFSPLPHLWRNRGKLARAWARRQAEPPTWSEQPWIPSP